MSQTTGRVSRLSWVFPIAIIACLLGTFQATDHTKKVMREVAEVKFESTCRLIQDLVNNHLLLHLRSLYDVRGFFAASGSVERDQFAKFIQTTSVQGKYPGLEAIQYVERVILENKEGAPGETFVVKYVEPYSGNELLLGFDLSSEPVRKKALEEARDTGEPAISQKVDLYNKEGGAEGFLVVLPVYDQGKPLFNSEQRRQALVGFVAGAFKIKELFEDVFREQNILQGIDVEIYQGRSLIQPNLLYDSMPEHLTALTIDGDHFHKVLPIRLGGQKWNLSFSGPSDFGLDENQKQLPYYVLIVGLIFTFLLAAIFYSMMTSRSLAEKMAKEMTSSLTTSEEALKEANDRLKTSVGELEERNFEFVLLGEMVELLQACATAGEGYDIIGRSIQKFFPDAAGGALCILNASHTIAEAVATWGKKLNSELVFSSDDCWALRRGKIYAANAADSQLFCGHLGKSRPNVSLCAPVLGQGETLGVLHLALEQPPSEFKIRLLGALVDQIGLAIGNLKLRETLSNRSLHDPLTGLFNRRYMEESLEKEMRRAVRYGRSLAVVILDLDHFKKFNDSHGHGAGDALLVKFAEFLQKFVRGYDVACRYGGEEFVLILPEISEENALKRARQLLEETSHLTVSYQEQTFEAVTSSIGIALFPQHGSNWESVLRAADAALYQAKAQGRNRAVMAAST